MVDTPSSNSVRSQKSTYVRLVEARLAEKKAKLVFVKTKVANAALSGRIGVSEQLKNAERQADSHLENALQRLARLKHAGEDSWQELSMGVDTACADLSQSIRKIVARFP